MGYMVRILVKWMGCSESIDKAFVCVSIAAWSGNGMDKQYQKMNWGTKQECEEMSKRMRRMGRATRHILERCSRKGEKNDWIADERKERNVM